MPQTSKHPRDPHTETRSMHNLRQPANPEGNSASRPGPEQPDGTAKTRKHHTNQGTAQRGGGNWQTASLQPNRLGPLQLRQIPASDQTPAAMALAKQRGAPPAKETRKQRPLCAGSAIPSPTDQPACQRAAGLRDWYFLKTVACFQRCRHRPPGFPREPCLATSRGTAVPGTRTRRSGWVRSERNCPASGPN